MEPDKLHVEKCPVCRKGSFHLDPERLYDHRKIGIMTKVIKQTVTKSLIGILLSVHVWFKNARVLKLQRILMSVLVTDTVVFHPKDSSTDFLAEIYKGKGFNVCTDISPDDTKVRELIQEHDRVICLGHGSPEGLFGGLGMLINDTHAEFLKDKEVVAIWCHADQYMEKHGLHGFYSGMFVSEEIEARYVGIKASHQQIQHSNEQFAIALGKYIDDEEILHKIKSEYKKKGDPVIEFNRAKLFSIYPNQQREFRRA